MASEICQSDLMNASDGGTVKKKSDSAYDMCNREVLYHGFLCFAAIMVIVTQGTVLNFYIIAFYREYYHQVMFGSPARVFAKLLKIILRVGEVDNVRNSTLILVYLCNLGNPVVMLIFENVRILLIISDVHFKNIMIVNDTSRVVKMTIMTPQL